MKHERKKPGARGQESEVRSQKSEAPSCHSERSEESEQLFSAPTKLPGFFAAPKVTSFPRKRESAGRGSPHTRGRRSRFGGFLIPEDRRAWLWASKRTLGHLRIRGQTC